MSIFYTDCRNSNRTICFASAAGNLSPQLNSDAVMALIEGTVVSATNDALIFVCCIAASLTSAVNVYVCPSVSGVRGCIGPLSNYQQLFLYMFDYLMLSLMFVRLRTTVVTETVPSEPLSTFILSPTKSRCVNCINGWCCRQ